MNKIRGIGTDGASTMMGCRNGVVAQLKRITPSAIGVYCAAHRLNWHHHKLEILFHTLRNLMLLYVSFLTFMLTVQSILLDWKWYKAIFKKNKLKSWSLVQTDGSVLNAVYIG